MPCHAGRCRESARTCGQLLLDGSKHNATVGIKCWSGRFHDDNENMKAVDVDTYPEQFASEVVLNARPRAAQRQGRTNTCRQLSIMEARTVITCKKRQGRHLVNKRFRQSMPFPSVNEKTGIDSAVVKQLNCLSRRVAASKHGQHGK